MRRSPLRRGEVRSGCCAPGSRDDLQLMRGYAGSRGCSATSSWAPPRTACSRGFVSLARSLQSLGMRRASGPGHHCPHRSVIGIRNDDARSPTSSRAAAQPPRRPDSIAPMRRRRPSRSPRPSSFQRTRRSLLQRSGLAASVMAGSVPWRAGARGPDQSRPARGERSLGARPRQLLSIDRCCPGLPLGSMADSWRIALVGNWPATGAGHIGRLVASSF